MNKLRLIKLTFKEPLHIHGTRSDYAETLRQIHSDTLYAAIMQSWAIMGMNQSLNAIGQADDRKGELNFTFSSLFPYATSEGGQVVYFLPRPKKAFNNQAVEDNFKDNKKDIKKVEWLDTAYFMEQLQEADGLKPQKGDVYDKIYLSKTSLKFQSPLEEDCKKEPLEKFIYVDSDPHANIPRDIQKEKTNPYTFERLRFAKDCGFYFLFEGTDETFEIVKMALDLLKDEGLGTDRNLGNGQFYYKTKKGDDIKAFTDLFNVESEYRTNLSLFMPESADELEAMLNGQDRNVGYELVKRGGWLTTEPNLTLHKKSVFMFAEGSVFKTNKAVAGLTTNVRPNMDKVNHPVWRVGRSFFVPIKF